ncbi:rod shape-determining protein MreD [Nocardioides sp.]|uniref:rod shape-determining protein MreD n=1 Tax=Nocardioides sp. TaxID=35761 RepID=UPI0026267240|nr:rod shape-determining protein MreD [Nocardioides sp.]
MTGIDLRRIAPWVLSAVLVSIAFVLQVSVFDTFSWHGAVPDLALLVVVAAALVRGSQFGLILGFATGLLLDVAPPADHLAGRWALALLIVGLIAGRVGESLREEERERPRVNVVVATALACSFAGTSIFALLGLVLRDPAVSVGDLLGPVGAGLVWDLIATPFVVPVVMLAFRRLDALLTPAPAVE